MVMVRRVAVHRTIVGFESERISSIGVWIWRIRETSIRTEYQVAFGWIG